MTSTAERSAHIRAALKAKGITSKDVSVRTDNYSMGSSINIKIKNPNVSKTLVESIANEHESVRRCEYSGEILSGGNRYVFVEYDRVALDAFAAEYRADVSTAAAKLAAESENALIPIGDTGYLIGKAAYGFSLWRDAFEGNANTIDGIATSLGVKIAARRVA